MQKILVIGATGMLGKPVTNALINAGFEVTVMSRQPAIARQFFPTAHVLTGDVLDTISLLAAFEGQDAVYINLQAPRSAKPEDQLPEREGMNNILYAARITGVKRIAYLSSLVKDYNHTNGYHWWVLDMKEEAIEKIKSAGIPFTIFYASTFMESFDQLLLKGNKIILAGSSKQTMYFIAGKDYGQQVVRSFQLLTHENKEYKIQGPEAYNWDDGARIFIQHYTKTKLRTLKAPLWLLKLMGRFNGEIQYGAKIIEAMHKYPEKFEAEKTWEELGKPKTTISEYAKLIISKNLIILTIVLRWIIF